MMVVKNTLKIMGLLVALLPICACNSIEKRNEVVPVKKLPAVSSQSKERLAKLWSANTGASRGKSYAVLSPVVGGSKVYAVDAKGQVSAYDKKTGKRAWKVSAGHNVSSGLSPAESGVLAVGAYNLTYIDGNTGQLRWQVSLDDEVFALPSVKGRYAYVHTLGGAILSLDLTDGNVAWRYSSQTPGVVIRKSSKPAVIGDKVVAGLANGNVVALKQFDGTPIWEQQVAVATGKTDFQRMVDITSDPVVDDSNLFISSYNGNLMSIDHSYGSVNWKRSFSSMSGGTSYNGKLYFSDAKGHLWCFSANSGDEVWHLDALQGRMLTAPVIFNGILYVGSNDGYLHAIGLNGKYLNRLSISKGVSKSPVINNKTMYVLSNSGDLISFKAKD